MIGPREFVELTGHIPHQDDLDRANCPNAGEIMHHGCGVCPVCNRIRWNVCICDPRIPSDRVEQIVRSTNTARRGTKAWLAEVDALLAKEFWPDSDGIDWTTVGSHDFWHDAYQEKLTPQEAVLALLEIVTNPQHSGNVDGLVLL